jgi:predicted nucleic acid-binding Zn ribbon protein
VRPIARAIQSALRTLGIDQGVARVDAVRAWQNVATAILGADAVTTRALRADGDTLVVLVPTAQWAGEIRLRERDLLRALAERAPASRIARLRCVPSP